MTVWNEIPELIKYTKENPPPKCPKRRFVSLNPCVATKAYRNYVEKMNNWEFEGMKILMKKLLASKKPKE